MSFDSKIRTDTQIATLISNGWERVSEKKITKGASNYTECTLQRDLLCSERWTQVSYFVLTLPCSTIGACLGCCDDFSDHFQANCLSSIKGKETRKYYIRGEGATRGGMTEAPTALSPLLPNGDRTGSEGARQFGDKIATRHY